MAAPTFDAFSKATTATSTTHTWTHVVGAGSNRVLVVGVLLSSGSATVTGITWNTSEAFTKVGNITNATAGMRTELWYRVTPTSGSHSIVVTVSASVSFASGATSWAGASQLTNPFGTAATATGNTAAPTVTVASTTVDQVIISMGGDGGAQTFSAGTGVTLRWSDSTTANGAYGDKAGAAGTTVSAWTLGGTDQWAQIAAPLNNAATTSTRTIPCTAAFQFTDSNTIPCTVALLQPSARTIPTTSALLQQNNQRAIPTVASLLLPNITRTIPAVASLGNTSRTIPLSAALLQTNIARTIATSVALLQPNILRTIPATAAFFITSQHTIPTSAALQRLNTTRTITSVATLTSTNNQHTTPTTVALLSPNITRTIPASVSLNNARTIPVTVALLTPNVARTIPAVVSIGGISRFIPTTTALLKLNNTRTIPATASLSTPPLLSGGVAVWASGTGTAQFDTYRATQYPDPAIILSTTGRVATSLTQWTAVTPTNTTLAVATSRDGVNWTPATNGSPVPNSIYLQPYPQVDVFTTNSSLNYTNTFRTGGSVATTTYDTTNSRLIMTGGTNGVYVFNALSRADVDLFCTSDQSDSGGLVFRFVDQSNFYYLQIGDDTSSVSTNVFVLQKVLANVRTTLATQAISFVRGTYKTIRVTMIAGVITAYLDGIQMLTYTDGSPLAAGKMGLYNNGGSVGSRYYQLRLQTLGDNLAGQWLYSKVTMTTTDASVTPQLTDLLVTTRGPGLDSGVIVQQLHAASTPFAEYFSSTFNTLVSTSANAGNDYYWSTDFNGVLTFASRILVNAPWCLTSADLLYTPIVKPTFAADLYRNRFTVSNCVGVTALQTETKIADGTSSSWIMGYPLYSAPTITVQGVAKTVGIQGTDTGKDFYWQAASNSISQDIAATTIASGYEIIVAYIGQFVTNVTADNLPEQAARALVEVGTSGIVEVWEDSRNSGQNQLLATDAAIYAAGILARYSNNNAVMIQVTTLRSGLAQGQMLSVFLPEFGLNNVQLFITKTITNGQQQADGSVLYTYQIEATSGPSLQNWSSAFIGA